MAVDNTLNYLLVTVIVPVVILVLKSLLGDEIRYWITFVYCYFNRPFDIDKNPDTHDWAMIYNPGSGCWECCSLTFHFGLVKGENGVFVHHYDKDTCQHIFTERVTFGDWTKTRKGKIKRLPAGLRTH